MNRISRATRIRTMTLGSTTTSLRSDVELQAVHGHDAAALARAHGSLADVARVPNGAAHLGLPAASGLERVRRQRSVTDERIHDVPAVSSLQAGQEGLTEEPQGHQRHDWEDQP